MKTPMDTAILYAVEEEHGVAPAAFRGVMAKADNFVGEYLDLDSDGIRAGAEAVLASHTTTIPTGAKGSIEVDVHDTGAGAFLAASIGPATVSAPDANGLAVQEFSTSTSGPEKSLAVHVRRPITGTDSFQEALYLGGRSTGWEFTLDAKSLLRFKTDLDFVAELLGADAPGAITYPDGRPMTYAKARVYLGGARLFCDNLSVRGSNNLDVDRHYVGDEGRKREQFTKGRGEVTASAKGEFDATGVTTFNRRRNSEITDLRIEIDCRQVAPAVGETPAVYTGIDIIIPAVKTTDGNPVASQGDLTKQDVALKAYDNGVDPKLTIRYRTLDGAL